MKPRSRIEQYLNAISTGDFSNLPDKPASRIEGYLANIAKNIDFSESIKKVEILNANLNTKIEEAKVSNTNLEASNQEATTKNTELQASLEETKKYIAGLDGSQDIPGMRMELTELQNGLKSNQSLEYSGSSISAENTLEGRTEGMRIKGRTLNNLFGAPYTYNMNTLSTRIFRTTLTQGKMTKGDYTLIFKTKFNKDAGGTFGLRIHYDIDSNTSGGYRTVSKVNGINVVKINIPTDIISFLFYIESSDVKNGLSCEISDLMILEGDHEYMNFFEGMKSVGEAEQEGDKYKISILSYTGNLLDIDLSSPNVEDGVYYHYVSGAKVANNDVFTSSIKLQANTRYSLFNINRHVSYWVGSEFKGSVKNNFIDNVFTTQVSPPYDCTLKVTVFKANKKSAYCTLGNNKLTPWQQYKKTNKKDFLINEPLRGVDDVQDIMFEEESKVKIARYIDDYTFTGDETMRDTTEQDEKSGTGKYKVFSLTVNKTIDINKNINNNFPKKNFSVEFQTMDSEGLAVTQYGIYIKILKSKLSTQGIEGFKAWLKANTTTIYFTRVTPVTEIVENCVDIDLDTFEEKTYFNILNSLPGTLDFKVPSNIASIVQNTAREVNNIWDVINNLLVPGLMDTKKTLALKTIKNNLK